MKKLTLIIDTREKDKKQLKRLKEFCYKNKIDFIVRKLDFGDYSFEFEGISYEKEFVLERKKTFDELAFNLSKKDIQRFSREFERARDCKIILFVEQEKDFFEEHKYRSRIPPRYFGKKIRTFINKYMIEMHLIKQIDSEKFIINQFQKYIKEVIVK